MSLPPMMFLVIIIVIAVVVPAPKFRVSFFDNDSLHRNIQCGRQCHF
jgi:hypothetical protein